VQALAAERVLEAAEARLERAKANLDNAQARADAQLNSSNDATRARLDMASAARDVAQSKGNLDRGRLGLRLLIGRDVRGPLTPPESLSRAAETFAGDAARLKRAALDQRSDVKAAHEQALAFREAADEPLYRLAPSIDLIGQLQANPDPMSGERWHEESVSLALTWTIFDGGARYGAHRVRAAQAASAALEERLLSRSVDNDVQTALVALDTARATLRVAEAAIATARANSEETEVLYQQGLARAIELTDANGRRFDAEVNLASAKLDVIDAYLQVRFAQGLPPVDAAPGAREKR
jgi:outer membrane protein TolC